MKLMEGGDFDENNEDINFSNYIVTIQFPLGELNICQNIKLYWMKN